MEAEDRPAYFQPRQSLSLRPTCSSWSSKRMRNLFRLRPADPAPNYSGSHVGKGVGYADNFKALPCRAHMWELEQAVLRDQLKRLKPRMILDFATGTGRIAALAKRTLRSSRVVGIDISGSMLSVAKKDAPGVEFVEADGRAAIELFGVGSFDSVTAFRFFPNAEPELREIAAEQIARLVRPGGHLIVNNHRGFWSPSYIAQRMRPGGHARGMLNSAMAELFPGFRLVETRSLGLWPQSERKPLLMPMRLWKAVEDLNAKRLSSVHRLGYDTLFLFEKHSEKP